MDDFPDSSAYLDVLSKYTSGAPPCHQKGTCWISEVEFYTIFYIAAKKLERNLRSWY